MDRDKNPLRTVYDTVGVVQGVTIFAKTTVKDNIFTDTSDYVFQSLEEVDVSKTLFTPAFMEQLMELLDNKAKR